ncbi:MAG: glycosyltransferase family 2 protein [Leucobacter sp.]
MDQTARVSIAAIVPCFNEEAEVAAVVHGLHDAVPGIDVYVYDNASTDRTAEVAQAAGAIVRFEERKGKGNVVRRAFADVDADIYLLIDGDNTYGTAAAPEMIRTLTEGGYDHILGCRVDTPGQSAYRPGHAQGNRVFNWLVSFLFGERVTDMLSGYRVFSRRFVKSFPSLSREFEIETELTVHSMGLRVPQREMSVGFQDRSAGSASKLRTIPDGARILWLILRLFMHERPLAFFGVFSAVAILVAVGLGIPVFMEFSKFGIVTRLPTAVLASSLVIVGVLSGVLGAVLSGMRKVRRETLRLAYLQLDPPPRAL